MGGQSGNWLSYPDSDSPAIRSDSLKNKTGFRQFSQSGKPGYELPVLLLLSEKSEAEFPAAIFAEVVVSVNIIKHRFEFVPFGVQTSSLRLLFLKTVREFCTNKLPVGYDRQLIM
ncbi:hypothetical protein DENIS_3203 [Desulfonema ishimotonii]|uniref:Uncharacterized protein n=1 Tax=Desulfonema ishimotonii TaxID=45657 RepID=A0A401FZ42_9BACT|nr:hypothetical protein DENIS_3203 [Desulfonema ishimotonii]